MDFDYSDKVLQYREKLQEFMDAEIYPREGDVHDFVRDPENLWKVPPCFAPLKEKAKAAGIWNWFLPKEYGEWSPGLSNLEYAPLAEVMGRVPWSSVIFNCNAPDRGNMEVLAKFGSKEQQDRWLRPLLAGEIRSSFAMTEPQVASSDATNMECEVKRDGDDYVLNGRKWWTTQIYHPDNEVMIVMGLTNPDADRHARHSMILVPTDTQGFEIVRRLSVFGGWHSPGGEGEIRFTDCRVPRENLILGEGRGFEIAQGRLGPGRFQYAMSFVGLAQRCLELMCKRAEERVAFGQKISEQSSVRQDIAKSRCEIEQLRLLVLAAADKMDKHGAKQSRDLISMLKIVAPKMCQDVADRAIQIHGGMGVSQDTPLADIFHQARFCRIADGPDEVHMSQLARMTMHQILREG
ncbi:MAG: acyl-CoA dehydrogenase [Myxococcota bacterium]|jgi:acyl-CoA dehydrogenase